MEKIIYLKYGELTLKGKNRKDFIKKLADNLKPAFQTYSGKITTYHDYAIIQEIKNEDFDNVVNVLKKTPGIHSINIAYVIEKDLEKIAMFIGTQINENNLDKWKIEVSRTDKNFGSNSSVLKRELGILTTKYTNLKPLLTNPNCTIQVDIKHHNALVYFQAIHGIDGLPIGTSGKALMLISGGIDSPVASHLLLKRGLKVDFITFMTPPHTSHEALVKVKMLVNQLTCNGLLYTPKLYIVNYADCQTEIAHISKESYRITLMRRSFFRIAKNLAQKADYQCIATGESLGQVASQTIESMTTINNVLDDFLILRPLVGLDKFNIIDIAKKIGTYPISVIPYPDSCSLFAPKNPITKPTIQIAEMLENELLVLHDLEKNALEKNTVKLVGKLDAK